MNNQSKVEEIIIEVSESEYASDIARGLEEDEVLHPGQHRFIRGGFLKRHGISTTQITEPVKVSISLNLDIDVLNYFKERAAEPDASPLQDQLNYALRMAMQREQPVS